MEIDKIFNQDCIDGMKIIPDESIDLIVTSPPYNKNFYAPSGEICKFWPALRGRQIAYDVYNDSMPPQEYESWQKKIISECLRVLKPSGSLFYNHKDILVGGVLSVLRMSMISMSISRLFGIEVLHQHLTIIISFPLPNISIG